MTAQTNGDTHFSPMSLTRHDTKDVADLIYASAPELFTLMFGRRAIRCLAAFVERSHNRFSHRYIRVAEKNQHVVGIATLVPIDQLSDNTDYYVVLNGGQRLWLKLLRRFILRQILHYEYPIGSLYIGNLAVAAEYRNQGIGRQLLSQCIADATATLSPLYISVDIHNPKAQKLYESLGFQVLDTKTLAVFGFAAGSRLLLFQDSK